MRSKIYSLFLTLIIGASLANASNPVSEADSAYSSGDYAEAISLLSAVSETEGVSAGLLYNLGNAYFQNGDFGQAMVCWERGRRLDPSNKVIAANMRYLRSRVEDANKAEQRGKNLKVSPEELSFFSAIGKAIARDNSSDMWAGWAACSFLLFLVGTAIYIFNHNVGLRKAGFFGGIICISASVLFLVFSFAAASSASTTDEGVITAFKVTLQTEPGKESPNGAVLTKGTEVKVLSEEQDAEGNVTWWKVRLNSDYIGWIKAEDLMVI